LFGSLFGGKNRPKKMILPDDDDEFFRVLRILIDCLQIIWDEAKKKCVKDGEEVGDADAPQMAQMLQTQSTMPQQ
jgi:hypothetical protein